MLIIDAHAHIYSTDAIRYPPRPKPLRPPAGTGTLEHLRREMTDNAVTACCVVQASSFYDFDNRFTMDTAANAPERFAGVCTLDPDNAQSAAELIRLSRNGSARGLRSLPSRAGLIDDPGVRALWRTAYETGTRVNLLIEQPLAEQAEILIRDFPRLPVVLDHCLNLKLGPTFKACMAALARLSNFKNVNAKLTFLPTGSGERFPCESLHAACLQVIGLFGPERCVWGSDFPNQLWTPKITYSEHVEIFTRILPISDQSRQHILGRSAARLWFPSLLQ